MTRFRVTAVPAAHEGFRLIKEFYDDRKDAEEYYRRLQSPEDSDLLGCGYDAVVIALDELSNDDWTNCSTKLITRIGE